MAWLISKALMKQYRDSESLRSSQAEAAESSVGNSSDGGRSVLSRSTPMPQAFLSPDRTTAISNLSRYGMILQTLTEDRGAVLLTWYREDFLASSKERRYSHGEDTCQSSRWKLETVCLRTEDGGAESLALCPETMHLLERLGAQGSFRLKLRTNTPIWQDSEKSDMIRKSEEVCGSLKIPNGSKHLNSKQGISPSKCCRRNERPLKRRASGGLLEGILLTGGGLNGKEEMLDGSLSAVRTRKRKCFLSESKSQASTLPEPTNGQCASSTSPKEASISSLDRLERVLREKDCRGVFTICHPQNQRHCLKDGCPGTDAGLKKESSGRLLPSAPPSPLGWLLLPKELTDELPTSIELMFQSGHESKEGLSTNQRNTNLCCATAIVLRLSKEPADGRSLERTHRQAGQESITSASKKMSPTSPTAASSTTAKTSPAQERVGASKRKGADSGARWLGSFAKFDPATSSWRTPRCSSQGGSAPFLGTWPRWGMMHAGACWERIMPVRLTSGTASGFLPTLVKYDATPGGPNNHYKGLGHMAKHARSLPTIVTAPHRYTPKGNRARRFAVGRSDKACLFSELVRNAKTPLLQRDARIVLNPAWAEPFMGWPEGWTDLNNACGSGMPAEWLSDASPVVESSPSARARVAVLGNGQVPAVAALAFTTLHGLMFHTKKARRKRRNLHLTC